MVENKMKFPSQLKLAEIRGGSWASGALCLRSGNRTYNSPGNRDYYVGFRLVRNSR